MAMDYGTPTSPDMGAAAIGAAKHAIRQIRMIWPSDRYRNVGITPMIGQNDVPDERFGLSDARRLTRFALRHHVGRLAFWSLGRDQECTGHEGNDVCSHISQSRLEFTKTFLAR